MWHNNSQLLTSEETQKPPWRCSLRLGWMGTEDILNVQTYINNTGTNVLPTIKVLLQVESPSRLTQRFQTPLNLKDLTSMTLQDQLSITVLKTNAPRT